MIRTATAQDLVNIMRVEQAAHSHPWATSVMQGYLQKAGACWLYERNGDVVGHAVVTVVVGDAELLTIAVHPDAQGQGIGQQLLNRVVHHANQHQAEQLFLEVRESNQAAIALYERAGFCQLGQRNNYYPIIDEQGKNIGREHALLYCLPL